MADHLSSRIGDWAIGGPTATLLAPVGNLLAFVLAIGISILAGYAVGGRRHRRAAGKEARWTEPATRAGMMADALASGWA